MSGFGVNEGKTEFTVSFLKEHGDSNQTAINKAWKAAGHDGTISNSLIYKMRSKLGLTRPNRSSAKKGSPKAKRSQAAKSSVWAPRSISLSEVGFKSTKSPSRGGTRFPAEVIDELEDGIDVLIQKIKELGGEPEIERALRQARRHLVRGHEA